MFPRLLDISGGSHVNWMELRVIAIPVTVSGGPLGAIHVIELPISTDDTYLLQVS